MINGFYWIRLFGVWEPAEFLNGDWWRIGTGVPLEDDIKADDFEIGERLIPPQTRRMEMTRIEQLKEECEKLLALLNDPHPGLGTWQEAVQRRRSNIYELPDNNSEKPNDR